MCAAYNRNAIDDFLIGILVKARTKMLSQLVRLSFCCVAALAQQPFIPRWLFARQRRT